MTERRIRMSTRDRLLRGEIVIAVIGPLRMPSRAAVVGALRTIAGYGPHTRIPLGFHVDGRNWVVNNATLDQWCDDLVVEIPPASAETIMAVAMRQTWLVDAEHPVRFVLAGEYLVQVNDHAIGDGVMLLDRLTTVVQLANGADAVPTWVTAPPPRWPLALALRHTLRRGSGAVSRILADRRADSALSKSRPDGTLAPWRPELAVVTVSSPASSLKQVQAWIRATDRSLTAAAALIVVLRRALEAGGVPVHPETDVVYNLRRYLPDDVGIVGGNFISGLPLRVSDPHDVKQVDAAMQRQLHSGRPLVALAIGVAKRAIFGGQFRMPVEVGPHPRARIMFNNMGLARLLQQLPWAAPPDERTCGFVVRADGPEDVTLLLVIVGGVIHLTASFHSNVFDEDAMAAALQAALDDPVAHLSGARGTMAAG